MEVVAKKQYRAKQKQKNVDKQKKDHKRNETFEQKLGHKRT